jgi:hypothetical protein
MMLSLPVLLQLMLAVMSRADDAPGHRNAAATSEEPAPAPNWCAEAPCIPQMTQPPCLPPPRPSPNPPLPACRSRRCPNDFINGGLVGTFPDGSDPCLSTHICVEDVFPGCGCYRGDCDSQWGIWCQDTIAAFDAGPPSRRTLSNQRPAACCLLPLRHRGGGLSYQ